MSIRVIYSTETKLIKNQGKPGKQSERGFDSLEKAKAAPLPEGYVTAFIEVENGWHVYTAKTDWEFHPGETKK